MPGRPQTARGPPDTPPALTLITYHPEPRGGKQGCGAHCGAVRPQAGACTLIPGREAVSGARKHDTEGTGRLSEGSFESDARDTAQVVCFGFLCSFYPISLFLFPPSPIPSSSTVSPSTHPSPVKHTPIQVCAQGLPEVCRMSPARATAACLF